MAVRVASSLDIIKLIYRQILIDAQQRGLLSENIEIHMGSKTAKELGLKNSLLIDTVEVPLIIEDEIISSDVYIFDPDWLNNDS